MFRHKTVHHVIIAADKRSERNNESIDKERRENNGLKKQTIDMDRF